MDESHDEAARIERLLAACGQPESNPIDRALAHQDLMLASGWPACVMAERLGVSESSVSRSLALLTLSPAMQEQVRTGQILPSTAYELAKVRDPAERDRLVNETLLERLSRDRVAQRVRRTHRPIASSSARPGASFRRPIVERARFVVPVGESRSVTIAGPQARRDNESDTGPALTLEELGAWVDELAVRLKSMRQANLSFPDAIKALASRSP